MNLIGKLIWKFLEQEKINIIMLLITSILVNLIQTAGISTVTANIINTIEKKKSPKIFNLLNYFVFISVIYLILYYIYRFYQNNILTKLMHWMRNELAEMIIKNNNENFSDKNFTKFNAPVNRISSLSFNFVSDLFNYILPNIAFYLVISGYFLFHDWVMGTIFILLNILVIVYVYFILPILLVKNKTYEEKYAEQEAYFLEVLNNMDKIVYRGQTKYEMNEYKARVDQTIKTCYDFYSYMSKEDLIINFFVYIIIFLFLYYITNKVLDDKMTLVLYITFINIILLYRDKMTTMTQQLTDIIIFNGRTNGVLGMFDDIKFDIHTEFQPIELSFDKITFRNVSFKYKTKPNLTFNHFNMDIVTTNKIIGITGISGRGKSTFMKLVLKMYKDYEGDILIDNVNIRDIDPDYIRKNIIYINQNSKLFDRLIVENMKYGCSEENECDKNLVEILKNYPKIRELFKDNDIHTTLVGSLGEKMSGGQRVVISIVAGLISPSVGLILDEPTTGLDKTLKTEVIRLIAEYKRTKKFIIIVTHDLDIYKILDEKIEL